MRGSGDDYFRPEAVLKETDEFKDEVQHGSEIHETPGAAS